MPFWAWSYLVTSIGLVGFWLSASRVWWSWYLNLGNQALWATYAVATEQWGFLISAAFYTVVFGRNALLWTRERNRPSPPEAPKPEAPRIMLMPTRLLADYGPDGRPELWMEGDGQAEVGRRVTLSQHFMEQQRAEDVGPFAGPVEMVVVELRCCPSYPSSWRWIAQDVDSWNRKNRLPERTA